MTRCVLWGNLYEAGYKEVVVVRNPLTIRRFPAESGNAEPETDAQKSLCVVQWPRGAAQKKQKKQNAKNHLHGLTPSGTNEPLSNGCFHVVAGVSRWQNYVKKTLTRRLRNE